MCLLQAALLIVLQELGKQNPELLAMINSNQEEFLRMINDPAPQGQPDMADLAAQLAGAAGGGGVIARYLCYLFVLPVVCYIGLMLLLCNCTSHVFSVSSEQDPVSRICFPCHGHHTTSFILYLEGGNKLH